MLNVNSIRTPDLGRPSGTKKLHQNNRLFWSPVKLRKLPIQKKPNKCRTVKNQSSIDTNNLLCWPLAQLPQQLLPLCWTKLCLSEHQKMTRNSKKISKRIHLYIFLPFFNNCVTLPKGLEAAPPWQAIDQARLRCLFALLKRLIFRGKGNLRYFKIPKLRY